MQLATSGRCSLSSGASHAGSVAHAFRVLISPGADAVEVSCTSTSTAPPPGAPFGACSVSELTSALICSFHGVDRERWPKPSVTPRSATHCERCASTCGRTGPREEAAHAAVTCARARHTASPNWTRAASLPNAIEKVFCEVASYVDAFVAPVRACVRARACVHACVCVRARALTTSAQPIDARTQPHPRPLPAAPRRMTVQ